VVSNLGRDSSLPSMPPSSASRVGQSAARRHSVQALATPTLLEVSVPPARRHSVQVVGSKVLSISSQVGSGAGGGASAGAGNSAGCRLEVPSLPVSSRRPASAGSSPCEVVWPETLLPKQAAADMRPQDSEETVDDPCSPVSPLTSFVRENMDEHFPKVAVVHAVCLRESGGVLKPHEQAEGPPASQCSTRRPSKDVARELTEEELKRLSQSAASYFHESSDENHKALNEEKINAILKEVRKRRNERTSSGQRSRASSVADVGPSRTPSKGSVAIEDLPQKQDLAKTGTAKKPAKNFLDQFGYGVKPKTPVDEPKELPPELAPRDSKKSGFASISRPKNDLKERLAARRRHTLD